jgi:hypothetical protein
VQQDPDTLGGVVVSKGNSIDPRWWLDQHLVHLSFELRRRANKSSQGPVLGEWWQAAVLAKR